MIITVKHVTYEVKTENQLLLLIFALYHSTDLHLIEVIDCFRI